MQKKTKKNFIQKNLLNNNNQLRGSVDINNQILKKSPKAKNCKKQKTKPKSTNENNQNRNYKIRQLKFIKSYIKPIPKIMENIKGNIEGNVKNVLKVC